MIDASYDMAEEVTKRIRSDGGSQASIGFGGYRHWHSYGQPTALIRAVPSACLEIADCYQSCGKPEFGNQLAHMSCKATEGGRARIGKFRSWDFTELAIDRR